MSGFKNIFQGHKWKKSTSQIPLTSCTPGLEPLEQIPTVFNPRERRISFNNNQINNDLSNNNDSSDDEPTHCYWPPLGHPIPPCPPYSDFKPHMPQPPSRHHEDSSPISLSPGNSSDDERPPPYITISNTHPQMPSTGVSHHHQGGTASNYIRDSPDTPEGPIFANVEIGKSCEYYLLYFEHYISLSLLF